MKYPFMTIIMILVFGLICCSKEEKTQKSPKIKQAKRLIQKVKILSINSSQAQKKNSTPFKLFDQNSKTAWLIKGDNKGLGEYFEIVLTDEILFNQLIIQQSKNRSVNRIKKILMSYGDQYSSGNREIYLANKQNPQKITFDEMLSAKRITFLIQEIYAATGKEKRNSALAELTFFHNDEKVILKDWQKSEQVFLARKISLEKPHKAISVPTESKAIQIKQVLESSYKLSGKKNRSFKAANLIDKNPKTVWIEGQLDEGIKEYIQFDLKEKKLHLKGISLRNGYAWDKKLFKKHNRLKKISLEIGLDLEDGQKEYFRDKSILLKDTPKPQFHPLNIKLSDKKRIKAVFITLTIHSVYYGSKSKETVLSEVRFFQ